MSEKTVIVSDKKHWTSLAGFLALIIAVQVVAAALTNLSVGDWYLTLVKPSWTPPGWVFGPVWTLLYIGMAVSAWLVWRQRQSINVRPALWLFAAQLTLNVIWSGLFFGLKNPGLAFWEITGLWLAIIATLIAFLRVRRSSGILLVPYLLWVTYASALNFAIWRLNS